MTTSSHTPEITLDPNIVLDSLVQQAVDDAMMTVHELVLQQQRAQKDPIAISALERTAANIDNYRRMMKSQAA